MKIKTSLLLGLAASTMLSFAAKADTTLNALFMQQAAYSDDDVKNMTKAAIDHLTRCLAYEWGPHNITVNAVAPTFIWTDGTRPALSDPEFLKQTVARIPLGRIGEPKEVAGAVVFLASPAASLINGTILRVDGGWCTT